MYQSTTCCAVMALVNPGAQQSGVVSNPATTLNIMPDHAG
jgi:hypothetical protein